MDYNPNYIEFMQDKKLKQSNLIFDGAILQLYLNHLEINPGQVVERELVHHQAAVAILATTVDNQVVLVEQYRPALVRDFIEIPAGLRDLNEKGIEEDALETAKRELEEETGYQADYWKEMGTYYLSPGYLNEAITIFRAKDLHQVENPLAQDEDEFVMIKYFSKTEIKQKLAQNDIQDLKTVLALNYWLYQEVDHNEKEK